MKKIGLMVVAFVAVHLVLAGLFWAGGYDFDKRGFALGTFSYLGMTIGALAAFIVHLFYEDKK